MTYLPLARKYRPQDFDDIVGQEHITTILKNAISLNRVHHAYLFTGLRGIGKTSTARIFSKALNCEKGPSPTPCNKCISCGEISAGTSLDVIEIDGASNRGIEDIRNLRETVKFAPSKGPYKIYIIDEVHMLTTEAFNALLKTLEEPPSHVKFIFATTEPHKLLPTILSRCQRFDFRRIPVKDIVKKLQEIAIKENLDIEDSVFLYIAKSSDGSMRDAESILDQVSSFSKGKLSLKDVIDSLGMISQDVLFECADFIINKDTKSALSAVDKILNSGRDPEQFLLELLEHFRNIMLIKCGVSSEDIIDLPKEFIEIVLKQSQQLSQGDIFYIINLISNSLKMIKRLLPERIVLELMIIKLTSRESISSIEEILSKLPELSKYAENTAPPIQPKPERSFKKEEEKKISNGDNKQPVVDIARVKDAWPILVKAMAVKKMSISSYLGEGGPDYVKENTIFVGFPKEFNFHREVLEEPNNKSSIEASLSQILDINVKLQFIATDKKPNPGRNETNFSTKEEIRKKEPIIDTTLSLFGGKILKSKSA